MIFSRPWWFIAVLVIGSTGIALVGHGLDWPGWMTGVAALLFGFGLAASFSRFPVWRDDVPGHLATHRSGATLVWNGLDQRFEATIEGKVFRFEAPGWDEAKLAVMRWLAALEDRS